MMQDKMVPKGLLSLVIGIILIGSLLWSEPSLTGAYVLVSNMDTLSRESRVWSSVDPGEFIRWEISHGDIAVTGVEFTPKKASYSVEVDLRHIKRPSKLPEPPGYVYQYLLIGTTGLLKDEVGQAKVSFQVDKQWIDENRIESVSLYHYYSDLGWRKLRTWQTLGDVFYQFYDASVDEFDYFAIVGLGEGPVPREAVAEQPAEIVREVIREVPAPPEKQPAWLYWIMGALLVGAAGFLVSAFMGVLRDSRKQG